MGCNHTRVRGVHYVPPFSSIRIPVVNPTVTDIDGNVYTYVTIGTQQWLVENLSTTKYADGTPIPNIVGYNDWFLPSKDELNAMHAELMTHSVGGFADLTYWSSSESDIANAWCQYFGDGSQFVNGKNELGTGVRACRAFTSTTNHNLRDIGPSGGLIFWKSGNNYLETAPSDQSISYIWGDAVGEIGVTAQGTAIGTGQANTTVIINQVGHTDSAAKLCDDLTSDMLWSQDINGAYCWYNNDIANKTPYGALYNWYAVDNAHGLAPMGWRVSSDTDIQTMIDYCGGNLIADRALREVGFDHWYHGTFGEGFDSFGFKGVGSGSRQEDGTFLYITVDLMLWTSTQDSPGTYAWTRLISPDQESIPRLSINPRTGLAIRCVRDLP